jgi:hypothetical protein
LELVVSPTGRRKLRKAAARNVNSYIIYKQQQQQQQYNYITIDIYIRFHTQKNSSKYKFFVKDRWHTFDIVVVVMDAHQAFNIDEQHALLQLLKENLETSNYQNYDGLSDPKNNR